ncbi:MAG TPA: hypothetical protein VLV83_21080 [Acidobacteriota bacterium]|nr:hypothetical protein [Acidobacteriota bacterium]
MSRTQFDTGFVTLLHTVDLGTGSTTLVGDTGFPSCFGLEVDQASVLHTICRHDGFYHLTRLDSATGQGTLLQPVLPEFQDLPNGVQGNTPVDFLLTPDRIGIINRFTFVAGMGLPAVDRAFEVYDRQTSDLLVRAPTGALALSDETSGGHVAAVLDEFGDIVLGQLSLQTAQRQISFGLPFTVRDLVRTPETTEFLVLAVNPPPANQVVFLARIVEDLERAFPRVSVPSHLRHLAILQPSGEEPPPSVGERIVPIIEAGGVTGGSFSSHLTLLHSSGTADQDVGIQFFDSGGESIDAAGVLCPGQAETLEGPLAARHLLDLDLSGLPTVAGWARLRAQPQVALSNEVLFATGGQPGCDNLATTLPSQSVQTTVQIAPVRPAQEWSADVVIRPQRESAFALVNPDLSESALVTVTAFDAQGEVFDSNEIELPPGQRISQLLFELLNRGKVFIQPPQRPADYRGSIRISADRPIAVAGLNVLLPEGKWSNIIVKAVDQD